MQHDHRPQRVLIAGQSGTGKTTYLIRFLNGAASRCTFVFDPEGELGPKLGTRPARTHEVLLAQLAGGLVVFDPSQMFPGDNAAGFDWFARWSFFASHKIPGRKIFVADELQKFTDGNRLPHGLALVLDTGRRYGLDAAFACQAPNRIHNGVRSQLTELVAFKLIEARGLAWLADLDFDTRAVCRQRPGQFIARNLLSGGEARGKVF